ncbi:MAG: hypothetical protein ABL925_10330, partial [Methylococcales bacterium]
LSPAWRTDTERFMRLVFIFLGLMLSWTVFAEQDEYAWQYQSYKQSKRLPDLHHAVDIKLLDTMRPPVEFQLKTGRLLQCKTCHGLDKMDEIPYDKVDLADPKFLRGGPYEDFEKFCYQCHAKKENERPNIHVLIDEKGALKEQNCLYCHQEVNLNRNQPRPLTEVNLRLPIENVCLGCHLKTPHLNALEHQEAKPKDKMKKHMKKSATKHGIILPLAADGKVICVSCHSPHPALGVIDGYKNPAGKQVKADIEQVKKGIEYSKHSWETVFKDDKQQRLDDLAFAGGEHYQLSYQRIKSEVLLRLPAKNGSLCLSCHEFER